MDLKGVYTDAVGKGVTLAFLPFFLLFLSCEVFLFAGFALRAIGWTEGLRSGAGEGILVRPKLWEEHLGRESIGDRFMSASLQPQYGHYRWL